MIPNNETDREELARELAARNDLELIPLPNGLYRLGDAPPATLDQILEFFGN
ncbi:hypothetical protein [uncultured Victivallis sp.]|uniref:hypothetical protein n=1 Tax=uncultured Victivallis sp. TaxID=354118 RepID=UPI0025D2599D|nr:hypothetical protein [uncultured Victivallis sp.]